MPALFLSDDDFNPDDDQTYPWGDAKEKLEQELQAQGKKNHYQIVPDYGNASYEEPENDSENENDNDE